jgi:hypothetical protein
MAREPSYIISEKNHPQEHDAADPKNPKSRSLKFDKERQNP